MPHVSARLFPGKTGEQSAAIVPALAYARLAPKDAARLIRSVDMTYVVKNH